MAGWGYAAVIGAALSAAALVLWQRRQSRKILENLGKMLEAAMEGNFTEDSFNESLLSALESSFARYLAASTVSARKVDAEKEKLKALIGDISHQTKTPIANIPSCSKSSRGIGTVWRPWRARPRSSKASLTPW